MVNIEIEFLVDKNNKEVFMFHLFDLTAVFTKYLLLTKPDGKRTWKVEKKWDRLSTRDSNIPEPNYTVSIAEAVRENIISQLKIQNWKQFKGGIN